MMRPSGKLIPLPRDVVREGMGQPRWLFRVSQGSGLRVQRLRLEVGESCSGFRFQDLGFRV